MKSARENPVQMAGTIGFLFLLRATIAHLKLSTKEKILIKVTASKDIISYEFKISDSLDIHSEVCILQSL
jgi:hypothetical protein